MADEETQQQLVFKMVNGDEHRKTIPSAGAEEKLRNVLYQHGEEWIEVDDSTHIRKAQIVSVQLRAKTGPMVAHA